MDLDLRDLLDHFQKIIFSLRLQLHLQLQRPVKMILDGTLVAARDDEDLLDARSHRFFNDELDGWLIDDGQHLLRLRLRRRQEARPQTRCRYDCLSYLLQNNAS